jgi:lysyl-tRNA synthetase class 2
MSATVDGDTSRSAPDRVRRLPRGPRPGTVPALAGTAVTAVGLVDIAAGILPRFRHSRTHTIAEALPGAAGPVAAALSLSAGVLLLLLARGIKRHKRRAWRAAVVLLPAGAVAQLVHRHSVVGALLSLALLGLLLRHRVVFTAPPDPRSRWRALTNFVLMGAGSLVLGLVTVSAHPGRIVGSPGLTDRLEHVIYGLAGFEGPLRYSAGVSWTVGHCLGALGLLTVVTTGYLALRPERPAARVTGDDERRLRDLLALHGVRDPLGHVARRDKGVVFSPSGKAAVRYRVVSGVMLAGGDPLGDVEAWPGAIERFMDEAKARSWTPAVTGCSKTGCEVWSRETGLGCVEPGDEAVVDAADFSAAGRAPHSARRTVQRIERDGHDTQAHRARDRTDDGPGTSPYGDLKAVIHFVPRGRTACLGS